MRQQVNAVVHLTYDASARLSAKKLQSAIMDDVNRLMDADSGSKVELVSGKVVLVKEEAEIFGNADPRGDMLRLIKAVLGVCDMSNPAHDDFADSAADCLQELLLHEPEMREIVARLEKDA